MKTDNEKEKKDKYQKIRAQLNRKNKTDVIDAFITLYKSYENLQDTNDMLMKLWLQFGEREEEDKKKNLKYINNKYYNRDTKHNRQQDP
jgi:TolA-binding protein